MTLGDFFRTWVSCIILVSIYALVGLIISTWERSLAGESMGRLLGFPFETALKNIFGFGNTLGKVPVLLVGAPLSLLFGSKVIRYFLS